MFAGGYSRQRRGTTNHLLNYINLPSIILKLEHFELVRLADFGSRFGNMLSNPISTQNIRTVILTFLIHNKSVSRHIYMFWKTSQGWCFQIFFHSGEWDSFGCEKNDLLSVAKTESQRCVFKFMWTWSYCRWTHWLMYTHVNRCCVWQNTACLNRHSRGDRRDQSPDSRVTTFLFQWLSQIIKQRMTMFLCHSAIWTCECEKSRHKDRWDEPTSFHDSAVRFVITCTK